MLAALFVLINTPNTFSAEQKLTDLNARGKEALGAQRFEVAIGCYSQALEIDPNSEEALFNRGLGYYSLKKSKDARADFMALNKLRPDAAGFLFYIGLTCFQEGNYPEARSYFEEAYELKKDPLYVLNTAAAFYQQRKYHAAIQQCKQALKLRPDDYLKDKIGSLLSRSEQAAKNDLQNRIKQKDSARFQAEQEMAARETELRKRAANRVQWTSGGTGPSSSSDSASASGRQIAGKTVSGEYSDSHGYCKCRFKSKGDDIVRTCPVTECSGQGGVCE